MHLHEWGFAKNEFKSYILIPSEEHKVSMYPMDFEEFLWATGHEITAETIKLPLKYKKPAGNAMHRKLMRKFRLYMLIGGMPQAIETYLEQNNLQLVDEVKREIHFVKRKRGNPF